MLTDIQVYILNLRTFLPTFCPSLEIHGLQYPVAEKFVSFYLPSRVPRGHQLCQAKPPLCARDLSSRDSCLLYFSSSRYRYMACISFRFLNTSCALGPTWLSLFLEHCSLSLCLSGRCLVVEELNGMSSLAGCLGEERPAARQPCPQVHAGGRPGRKVRDPYTPCLGHRGQVFASS